MNPSFIPLGLGTDGTIYAFTTTLSGDLIVGGTYTLAGNGTVVRSVARWDGLNWFSLGFNGTVRKRRDRDRETESDTQ